MLLPHPRSMTSVPPAKISCSIPKAVPRSARKYKHRSRIPSCAPFFWPQYQEKNPPVWPAFHPHEERCCIKDTLHVLPRPRHHIFYNISRPNAPFLIYKLLSTAALMPSSANIRKNRFCTDTSLKIVQNATTISSPYEHTVILVFCP